MTIDTSKLKRYKLGYVHSNDGSGYFSMLARDDGEYVRLEDVKAITSVIEQALTQQLALSSPRQEGDSTAASTQRLQAEIDRLNTIINSPQSNDFLRAVSTEAEHQRQRWGSEHDSGKTPADWFWLVGYLAGKALHAHAVHDLTKAEHHVITAAAALANWHMAMFGNTDMRPGIDGESLLTSPTTGADGDNT